MATAQEILSLAIRRGISPDMKKLGFAGSGSIFELWNEKIWLLLGIQKSTSGVPGRLRITINLAAVLKEEWDSLLRSGAKYSARPNPNLVYGKKVWHSRIGKLMPGGQDCWWNVTGESDPDDLASSIVCAVESYALPALREQGDLLMRKDD